MTSNEPRSCIFVNGVWKSGNHLVYSALNELGVRGPFNGIAAHLLFGRHKLIKRLVRGDRFGVDVGLETEAKIRPGYVTYELRRLRGRIMGGHAAYSHQLERLVNAEDAKIIIIRRDPRDILMSFADWIASRPDYFLHSDFAELGRHERIRLLLRGGQGSGYRIRPFTEVLTLAEGWLKVPGALQISFEDLVGAQGGGDSEVQARIVAGLHEHVRPPKPMAEVEIDKIYGGTLTFNKGHSKRWVELDSPALVHEIQDKLGPHLEKWGY
jgi:hypothetical protein